MRISVDSEKFNDFIRILSSLSELCSDIDIRQGILRQKTNNSTCLFEIDLTSIIGNSDIPLSVVKSKLELLKSFYGQQVIIDSEESEVKFSDNLSSLKFQKPDPDFLDNKFMTEEQLNSIVRISEEDLLMNTTITKIISDRIRIVTKGFNVNHIQVIFEEGGRASISSETTARDQAAKFISNIVCEKELSSKSDLPVIPFVIDHDGDILCKMYETQNDNLINQFKTCVKDVNITVYCRSELKAE